MYDLTPFLTTIAAASASIVAILGGFIASTLISIDGERDSVLSRLTEIDEEIAYRKKLRDMAQKENDEDDALDFINDHLEELKNGISLTTIYKTIPEPDLPIETMQLYWTKAISVSSAFQTKMKHLSEEKLNTDYVPQSLYGLYHESNLEYQVCKLLGGDAHSRCISSNPVYAAFNPNCSPSFENRHRYRYNQQKIAEGNTIIVLLELQIRNLKAQITSLQKPKGMKKGLAIFALFSIGCIIAPIALSPFTTNDLLCYNLIKWIFLTVFISGLGSIFLYLIYLLHWKHK